MITVIHKDCGGPALQPDPGRPVSSLMEAKEIFLVCFTCLDEITDPADLLFGEEMGGDQNPQI